MGDIKEEDWNLPECKYECEACQKCFCIIPCYGSITNDHKHYYRGGHNEAQELYAALKIHAWGSTLSEAFEQCANAMFHYMTEVDYIEMKESYEIEVEGHDMMTLLYNFLDELLFIFSAEPNYIARKVQIEEFDTTAFKIKAKGFGEEFQLGKHPQGTEVKAITFSNMQIHENEGKCEVFVILDI